MPPFSSLIKNPISHFTLQKHSLPFSSSTPSLLPEDKTVISTAVALLKHHRSKSRWTHLRQLFPAGFTPTQVSQITLQLRNNPHLALNYFNFTVQHSLCNHSLDSYATIIHVLARGRQKSEAQRLIQCVLGKFREAHLGGFVKYPKIFECLMRTYRVCDSAPFVFDLLVLSLLLAKRIDQAVEIERMLRTRGMFLKISTLNDLIKNVCKCVDCFVGYDLYKEIFNEGNVVANGMRVVVPNVGTFNVIMVGFYREGLVENVEEVWGEMVRRGCEANSYSFSVLMAVYCEGERMVDALRVWEEMGRKGLERDLVAYNTIIGGFCKVGEVERAEEFFREMEFDGVDGSCVTFEHLISGYCRIGDVDSALLLYKGMCRKGFRPESLTIDEVIRGLCGQNRVSEALEYLRVAVKKYDIVPKGTSYESVIKGLCQEGRMEDGLKLQAEMVGKGHEPNSEIYNSFIDGYMKQGNEEQARKLRKEMVEIHEQQVAIR
ncbi:Pentatricopeptide repeat-containing protein [Heracleum sosnowskyi]|uniref:Pentatricopeptide repeat-containing protein n=1 Tax=Heracleum sosnowskyi TaxID=360622 RepID=A0AAD8M3X6_9APIA|nr:Pentatricopeptide repeat-containing protein [Heracleum sosnowskyi]